MMDLSKQIIDGASYRCIKPCKNSNGQTSTPGQWVRVVGVTPHFISVVHGTFYGRVRNYVVDDFINCFVFEEHKKPGPVL